MSDFEFVICIPARYASSRLPGKPLIKLKGKELILWAVDAANQLGAKQVVVATDDERIKDVVEKHGHQVVMTSEDHTTGTDRIAECAQIMNWPESLWVLNYQGDEPGIPRANVEQVIEAVNSHPGASIATLYQNITNRADLFNPNLVKLVTDDHQKALYFSRAPIPWSQKHFTTPVDLSAPLPKDVSYKHHIGLYMYKVGFLNRFSLTDPSRLEKTESLEQLRAMSMGETIVAAPALETMPHGIDTAADVERFENS